MDAQVDTTGQLFNQSLRPEQTTAEPIDHFSPTRVRFPVNAPELRPPVTDTMTDFDQENGTDTAGAFKAAIDTVKSMTWEENEPGWFFNQFEIKLQTCGVKKQWTKLQTLSTILPKFVIDEIKQLLAKKESEWTDNDAYHRVKSEILEIFGPADDVQFERAMSRILSGTPSQLARALVNDLCDKQLDGCCCKKFIVGLWKRSLPSGVKQKISDQPFTKDNFRNICKLADDAYRSNRPVQAGSVAAVTMGATNQDIPTTPGSHDEGFHQYWPNQTEGAVAAFGYNRGRGRGGRGNRGGRGQQQGQGQGRGGGNRGSGNSQRGRGNNSGGQNQGQRGRGQHHTHRTPRHADLPPFESCFRHWTYGKSAHFCVEPGTCPWSQYFVPKSNNQ